MSSMISVVGMPAACKKVRQCANWSKLTAASRVGVNFATWNKWEEHDETPIRMNARKIAAFTEVYKRVLGDKPILRLL